MNMAHSRNQELEEILTNLAEEFLRLHNEDMDAEDKAEKSLGALRYWRAEINLIREDMKDG